MSNYTKEEIYLALEKLAFKKTIPFCYSCYIDAPTGTCKKCFSDDLMRHLPGFGVEHGTDWVIKEILNEYLSPIDTEECFEESVNQCYEETVKIAWIEFDTVLAIKNLDPISWDMAKSEWISIEEDDGSVYSPDNGSTYYWIYDIEELLKISDIHLKAA